MPAPVYLDTARLGRISPTALAIQTDYLRFTAARGCSAALLELLSHGGDNWPVRLQRQYPQLANWCGISSMKQRLRAIAGADEQSSVLLASRTSNLMKLAAYLLIRNSETVVTVDLGWPHYIRILSQIASKFGRQVIVVPLREPVQGGLDVESLIKNLLGVLSKLHAPSLFLPAISHDGVRLPIRQIVRAIKATTELRFFVVDGAQHLAHGDSPLTEMDCDFYFAGTHKWLRSLYPLGVAFYRNRRSTVLIETTMAELASAGILDDPLTRFTAELETGLQENASETVNLSALFSAYGAAGDTTLSSLRGLTFASQLQNAEWVDGVVRESGWRPIRLAPELSSGILLLQPPGSLVVEEGDFRKELERRGIVATTYQNGQVRLSMPSQPLSTFALSTIRSALRNPPQNLDSCLG